MMGKLNLKGSVGVPIFDAKLEQPPPFSSIKGLEACTIKEHGQRMIVDEGSLMRQ